MKNVLITGGTKGIGLAILNELQSLGYRVFTCARNGEKSGSFLPVDLSTENGAKILYEAAKAELGHIDILINNAGNCIYSPIEEADENELKKLMVLNFLTPYLLSKYVICDMKKQNWGRIINIGSISGVVGEAWATMYSATKAGLVGHTKALALEVAQFGITVNQINPGWVETELKDRLLDEDEKQSTLDVIPQRRFVEPFEIAKLCAYLISDNAKGITGQAINLCAGLSCGA